MDWYEIKKTTTTKTNKQKNPHTQTHKKPQTKNPPLFQSTSKENTYRVLMRKEKNNSVRKNLPAHILYQFFMLNHRKCGIPKHEGQ